MPTKRHGIPQWERLLLRLPSLGVSACRGDGVRDAGDAAGERGDLHRAGRGK